MTKTYLVEEWDSEVEFGDNSLIVALTPKACYQLDKAGIKYSIIEDYYDEAELTTLEDEYHKSQLQWIDRLDEFLPKSGLKLATIYYYYLKTTVLDPLYIRCYTLHKLFEKVRPASVVFVSRPLRDIPLDFRLRYDGKSLYSLIIPILCRKNNIPLTTVFVGKNAVELKLGDAGGSLISRLRRILGKSKFVRRAYLGYKCFRWCSSKQQKKLNILILKSIGMDFLRNALGEGHNVYQLSGDFIIKHSSLGLRSFLHLKPKYETWEDTVDLLENSASIKWINERCQLDVSEIVLPKLKVFISKVCPEILGYFEVFSEFYNDEEIDFVLTLHEVTPIEFAAIAAASSRTKSVCLSHGDCIFAKKFWNITELSHFNILIASNKELKEYFEHQCKANNIPIELYNNPYRLLNCKRINHLRQGRKQGKRVIYLPTMLTGDMQRLDGATYPDTWYYEFQKSLIEHFSTKKEYIFVWKGLPTSDAIYNPIPNFIRDNNFSNIEIATNPFTEHLLSADKVICDYPSTGFYESVVAGVPTMSLYHKAFIVRKSAVDYFGNLLKLYSDIPEALKHIDGFL